MLFPQRTCLCVYTQFGGSFTNEPEDMLDGGGAADCCRLSPATVRVLREEVFHDLVRSGRIAESL